MRIALISAAYPLRGGIAHCADSIAQAAVDEGLSCRMYTFTYQYPTLFFPGTTQSDPTTHSSSTSSYRSEQMLHSLNPFSWRKTARAIQAYNPDIVLIAYWHPFFAVLSLYLSKVLRTPDCKVIGLFHSFIPNDHVKYGYRFLSKLFVESCDGCITLSQQVADQLSVSTHKPIRTVLHPPYEHFGSASSKKEARKKLGLAPDNYYLLSFGFLRPYKGVDLLLKALSQPQIKAQNVRLLLVGESYESVSRYHTLIQKFGLEDAVIWHDRYVSDAEVSNYFCAADVVVQSYKKANQSGVTQIAHHFKRPTIVTNVGGLAETVEHGCNGYTTEPTVEDITAALLHCMQPGQREAFEQYFQAASQKRSWSDVIQTLREMY